MAIRNWHYGKIILLWVAVGLFAFFWYQDAGGYLIVPLIVVIAAFVVTWAWFSGKDA